MKPNSFERLELAIEAAFERRASLSQTEIAQLRPLLDAGLDALDAGLIRAANPTSDTVQVNTWVKKLLVLSLAFGLPEVRRGEAGPTAFDKIALKFEDWDEERFTSSRIRVVPGAVIRRGAYLSPGVVVMPSFINVGAYIGESTMIDTWATVGSCAQIGARCHISGGAGIGGVLEPLGDRPIVIDDGVFIGARSEIAEGVRVRSGAVIGMGVFLGASTPIIDRHSGEEFRGEVPANAVVVPGSRLPTDGRGIATYAAIIVKYADDRTRGKTSLNMDVREMRR